jgi:thiamine pyrophosphokinase
MSRPGAEDRGGLLAVVFLDGDYGDPAWYRALAARADILLAADGGAAFLAREGLAPQAVVGDCDSLDAGVAGALEEQGVEFVRHPVRKDVTDGELAVEEALRRGAGSLLLAGATGALDHTLGHLAILRRLTAHGVAARLVAPDLAAAVLIAPVETVLGAPAGVRVSIVPVGAAAIVTLAGLDYPLDRGTLPADACLGLGNHVTAAGAARVVIHEGTVVALVEWGDEPFRMSDGVREAR